jgi:alpha,alpha-phosphotrehalase
MSFHSSVVYQIYPKSYYDSNGDGVGDLRGIIEKVPYIASLGIDYIWFNPFYPSPGRDNGYDISDYCAIDPAMGTMEDFEQLAAALSEHGIGIMLDMVLNHVSTEHEWFKRALAGEEYYQKFFYLRDPKPDGSAPTNWVSKFGGSAWAPFGDTGKYYLHLFDPTQADLDWHNPAVREEAAKVVNFWRSKGVHGFRFDVINLIGKSSELLDAPEGTDDRKMYTDGPDVHTYLRWLNENSFGRDADSITVGEMSSTTIEACIGYSNPANHELSMVFNFHHLKVDYQDGKKWTLVPYDLAELKRLLNEWALGMQAGGGWNALFWNNHDQPRALDRFGDVDNYRYESATMLASVIHLLRGTPFVYMGEEIGMSDPAYTTIEQYVDVEAHNAYKELLEAGVEAEKAFKIVHSKARDNARTPMQWDGSANAGFSTVTPWLTPTNQDQVNVAEAENGGILPYYRKLIALRKRYPIISEGTYASFAAPEQVFGYLRQYAGQQLLVLNNFRDTGVSVDIDPVFTEGEILIGNYDDARVATTMQLRPFESVAILVG